jgi:hypothetical protein
MFMIKKCSEKEHSFHGLGLSSAVNIKKNVQDTTMDYSRKK